MHMIVNYLKNYFAMNLKGASHVKYPMLASLYLTHRCNLRCIYCSDGNGKPFYETEIDELPTQQIFALLDRIAKSVKALDITGGEPLLRKDIHEILEYANKAGFRKIILNTNGLLLDTWYDSFKYVDTISISLDSMSPGKLQEIYNVDENAIAKILNNIESLTESEHSKKILISMVMLPQNIVDTYDILEFCKRKKIAFTCSPALKGTSADPLLQASQEYNKAIDTIIEYKKKGTSVIGSIAYYELIRDFKKYQCLPMLMPTINPAGELYIPCLENPQKMVPVLSYDSLNAAINNSLNSDSYPPECGNVCHILCHAGLSILYSSVSTLLQELWFNIQKKL